MAEYSIFGSTPGPSSSADPEGALNLAHQIDVTAPCWALGLRWWRVADITGPITGRLWRATAPGTGTPVAGTDVTFDLGSDEGWKTALFTAPFELAVGSYKPTVHTEGRWGLTGSYFSVGQPGHGGITSGPLTMPGPDAAYDAQGSFSAGPISTYPGTGATNRASYWVDLLVTDTDPEGGPEVADHTVPDGDVGVHEITLAANTETTVTFPFSIRTVLVENVSGAGRVYFTTDGTPATVKGGRCRVLPALKALVEVSRDSGASMTVIRLISATETVVSVTRG